jgi:peptidoglycan/LPS O-acetylase OafA/YrhL
MRRHFDNAQWLRFCCAFYLVLYHSLPAARVSSSSMAQSLVFGLFNLGFFATSIFFTLSGFILAHAYANYDGANARVHDPARFVRNRLSVIYPIHVLALLLYAVIAAASGKLLIANFGDLDQFLGREAWIKQSLGIGPFLLSAASSLTLTQAWNPLFLNLNGASWSLSALLFFYLLFPPLAPRLLGTRRKWPLLLGLWIAYSIPAIALTALRIDDAVWAGVMHRNPLLRLPEFLAGIVMYGLCRDQGSFDSPQVRRWLPACGLAVIAALLAAAWVAASGPRYSWYLMHNGALLPLALLVVFIASHAAKPPLASLGNRLGNASLCIFALHAPIGALFKLALAPAAPAAHGCTVQSTACAGGLSQVQALGVLMLYLVVVVAAAMFVQERFVAPLSRWLRGKASRAIPADAALAG